MHTHSQRSVSWFEIKSINTQQHPPTWRLKTNTFSFIYVSFIFLLFTFDLPSEEHFQLKVCRKQAQSQQHSSQTSIYFITLFHFPFWLLKQRLSTNDMMISISSSCILASLKINSQQQMFTIPQFNNYPEYHTINEHIS